jgi:carbon-monoxide dehydrogenase large subunit
MTSFGRSVSRIEDADLLTGRALFGDDLPAAAEALHLKILRSPFAHASINIDSIPPSDDARIFTYDDVAHLTWKQLLSGPPELRALAHDKVRYVGEPIAAVVSGDSQRGLDILGQIDIDFDPLPAVAHIGDAVMPDAPLVYESLGTNVVYRDESEHDPSLFTDADIVVDRVLQNHRIAPGMMETRAIIAVPNDRSLTVYVGHQSAHKLKREILDIFGSAVTDVRVVVPEVGGAFGAKVSLYPEYILAVHAALVTGRPVKFIETRAENLAVTAHGRGQVQRVQIGARHDGTVVGLKASIDVNFGAAIDNQRWAAALTRRLLSGAYRIPRIEWDIRGVLTHTAPTGAFRGAGRPEAIYLVERIMDELARELTLDPALIRKRNFIAVEDFPYATGTDATYDSGNYGAALEIALEAGQYKELRKDQADSIEHPNGRLIGVGLSSYVELTAGGEEYAEVDLDENGHLTVRTGTSPHGQGHHTTWSQLAAERLGLPVESTTVIHGDTDAVPQGGGTSGSRSAVLGGSAVAAAADAVAELIREAAAQHLEAAPQDIQLNDGRASVVGSDIGVDYITLIAAKGGRIAATEIFTEAALTYPFGSHLCAVSIDTATGEVEVLRYVAVDDCGKVINPAIVEGQLHGAVLQGVSHALSEAVIYDRSGQLLNGNFAAYAIPNIDASVTMTSLRTETPSPLNPLGLKGVGESGITGSTPAVANAVFDALAHLGIGEETLTMPFTPTKVWSSLNGKTS